MRSLLIPTIAMAAVSLGAMAAAADSQSGLEIGETAGAYNVKDLTGPNEGKSLCYRWQYGLRPVVNVFAREITDDLASLVKEIDTLVEKNKDKQMAAFVVLLSEEPDADEAKLKELAEKHGIKNVPLTIFDGVAGPPNYKIARDADVTVVQWVDLEVKANQAYAKGDFDKEALRKVLADTDKILK